MRHSLTIKGVPGLLDVTLTGLGRIALFSGQSVEANGALMQVLGKMAADEGIPCVEVPASGVAVADAAVLWQGASEGVQREITDRLRRIDPEIRGIVLDDAGFTVQLRGVPRPIPFGTIGGGMWRLFGLYLAGSAACSDGGWLVVDRIDTSLHYSAMGQLWRDLYRYASRSRSQIFATGYGSDCWDTLARLAANSEEGAVSFHRLQPGGAVGFDGAELQVAAQRGLEIR